MLAAGQANGAEPSARGQFCPQGRFRVTAGLPNATAVRAAMRKMT